MHFIKQAMIWTAAALLTAPAAVVAGSFAPAEAAAKKPGRPAAQGHSSVSRPASRPAGASTQGRPSGGGSHQMSASNRGNQSNVNRNQGNRPNVNNNNRGGNTVVVNNRNTVVAGNNRGGGYYNNGRYYDNDWDDNDNDFLEFVGKTAAVTAAVGVTTAIIGSVVNDKPDNCQQVVSGGQVYQYCNGTYYMPVSNGYQVVAPPR